MSQPEYALIFISWNSAALTVRTVQLAEAVAPDPGRFRIIIVDNGSNDGSVELFTRQLPNVEVVPMGRNRGFAVAANAGLQRLGSERFAFILNTDLEFSGNVFQALGVALEADPLAVLASPRLLRPDGSEQAAAVPEPGIFWELVNRSLPRRFLKLAADAPTPVPGIVGPCMAVHLPRLREIGFFDERFFFFFEETDLCRRINAAGRLVLFVPGVSVVHLQGESANRRPYRARVQFWRARYQYFRKHAGPAACALLGAGLWLKLTVSMLLQALLTALTIGRWRRCRDRLAVNALLWAWHLRGCPAVWGFEPPADGI